jgi:hypothetical protein
MKVRLGVGIWLREFLGTSRIERLLLADQKQEAERTRKVNALLVSLAANDVRHAHAVEELQKFEGERETKQEQRDRAQESVTNQVLENVDRVLNLIEPKARRLHNTRTPPPDWDQVQAENLQQQYKENEDGKPVRR